MRHSCSLLVIGLALSAPDLAGQGLDETFSNPTAITNVFAPFDHGAVKIFHGRREGKRTTTVINHLDDVRVFQLGGVAVSCCTLEEKEFEAGSLAEITLHYLAQDDAGNVRSFGEVSIEYADGVPVNVESDSWIVGGATQATDPPTVYNAAGPQMYMPATLAEGDVFKQEDFPHSDEVLTVVSVGDRVKVPSGKYQWSVKLRESSSDNGDDHEFRWVVPGVGNVKEKADGSKTKLFDTTLSEVDLESELEF